MSLILVLLVVCLWISLNVKCHYFNYLTLVVTRQLYNEFLPIKSHSFLQIFRMGWGATYNHLKMILGEIFIDPMYCDTPSSTPVLCTLVRLSLSLIPTCPV